MNYEILWLQPAQRDLKRLDPPVWRRVVDAVKHFAKTGNGDVARLVGVEPAEYRLREGDWRIRFTRDDKNRRLYVLRVLHRGAAYR